jgi:CheY-like chemotaxis protein/nitrogen-specific signal transduction histidine kinase
VAGGGVLLSFLLFALLRVQLNARRRAEEVADKLRESEAELQAASRAKDEFLATLSHELRTPMTAIIGWSKLLGEELDAETREVAIEAIRKSSATQAQLIEDLLDVSRITAGKMKIDRAVIDVGPIIAAAEAAIAPVAETKGVELQISVPASPLMVLGDAARLQQVVWNLLSNAVKFTDAGGSVSVSAREEGDQVVIDVSDTGKGIDPEFLPHVFERFRQADSSTTRSYAGLGLGLAIVRHLVEMHGGQVSAFSAGAGVGSRFEVRLPLLVGAVAPAELHHPHESAELRGAKVVVVDDEDDVRSYALTVFRMGGAEVRAAASAEEARELVQEWRPDIVVTDIGMPGEDGYDLLRWLRQQTALPVVALTAYAREEDRDRAEDAGFDAFVAKPVDPMTLRRAVAEVLGERVSASER